MCAGWQSSACGIGEHDDAEVVRRCGRCEYEYTNLHRVNGLARLRHLDKYSVMILMVDRDEDGGAKAVCEVLVRSLWCCLGAVGAGQAELGSQQASAASGNSGDSTLKFQARDAAAVATVRELPRSRMDRRVQSSAELFWHHVARKKTANILRLGGLNSVGSESAICQIPHCDPRCVARLCSGKCQGF